MVQIYCVLAINLSRIYHTEYETIQRKLTLFLIFKSAPLDARVWTIFMWPISEAYVSAVLPCWKINIWGRAKGRFISIYSLHCFLNEYPILEILRIQQYPHDFSELQPSTLFSRPMIFVVQKYNNLVINGRYCKNEAWAF